MKGSYQFGEVSQGLVLQSFCHYFGLPRKQLWPTLTNVNEASSGDSSSLEPT